MLLLDSDNLPLIDPTELFESEPFVKHGNLFWPDFWKRMWIKEEFYSKLGQDIPWQAEKGFNSAESGQVSESCLQCVLLVAADKLCFRQVGMALTRMTCHDWL